MSTIKCTNVEALAGGGAPDNLLPITCSAWANFNGSGVLSIRDSYNISSITDNGTGDFSPNFAVAMANANYSVVASSKGSVGSGNNAGNRIMQLIYDSTTSGFEMISTQTAGATASDAELIYFQVFGGQ